MGLMLEAAWLTDIIYGIMSGLYSLIMLFAQLLNIIQDLFRKMAGIEPVYYAGNTQGGDMDIITRLLISDVLQNALISVIILAVILLIMFTIFALIKQQYQVQPTATGEIIGRSIRALFGFLFIPILCIGGVYLGNIVLKAIDGATSASNSPTIGGQIFASSSFDASWLRKDDVKLPAKRKLLRYYANIQTVNGAYVFPGLETYRSGTDNATEDDLTAAALIIDKAIAANFPNLSINDSFVLQFNNIGLSNDEKPKGIDPSTGWADGNLTYKKGQITAFYTSRRGAAYFYDIKDVNYLFLIVGIAFTAYALCIITFGVIKRIFSLSILFVISPVVLALYPLDNGNAIGQWKSKFIADTITAYAAVGVFNLFLQVLSLVDGIMIYPNTFMGGFANLFINLVIMIVGCFVVTQIISTVAGFIGGSDAFSEGKSAADHTKKKLQEVKDAPGKAVQKVGSTVAKGADAILRRGKGGITDLIMPGMKKGIKDTQTAIHKSKVEGKHFVAGDKTTSEGRDQINALQLNRQLYENAKDKGSFVQSLMSGEYRDAERARQNVTGLKSEEETKTGMFDQYASLLGVDADALKGMSHEQISKLQEDVFNFSSLKDPGVPTDDEIIEHEGDDAWFADAFQKKKDYDDLVTRFGDGDIKQRQESLDRLIKSSSWTSAKDISDRLARITKDITVAEGERAKAEKIEANTKLAIENVLEFDPAKWKEMSARQQEAALKVLKSEGAKLEETATKMRDLSEKQLAELYKKAVGTFKEEVKKEMNKRKD